MLVDLEGVLASRLEERLVGDGADIDLALGIRLGRFSGERAA
jgi:hypothetical protein